VIDQANNQVQYTYDLNNQLKTVVQANAPDPAPNNTTTYAYDTNGNLTSLKDAKTHVTTNVFDAFNQLHQETMPAANRRRELTMRRAICKRSSITTARPPRTRMTA